MAESSEKSFQQTDADVKEKVKELEEEVKQIKHENGSQDASGKVKKADDSTKDTTKSPTKLLTVLLILGALVMFVGLVALVISNTTFLWALIVFIIIVVLLSDRIG